MESLCYVPAAAGLSAIGLSAIADVPAVANAILLLLMPMLLVASILNWNIEYRSTKKKKLSD